MASVGIVGAGLAGLAAGITLQEQGHQATIFEQSCHVGGRVASKEVDGHIVDEGFQIYIDGYPKGLELLDLEALQLRSFAPGAIIHKDDSAQTVGDPLRQLSTLPQTITSNIGTIGDKLKLLRLRYKLSRIDVESIWKQPDSPASDFLFSLGFSERFIENFWRPLFSGITLDPSLSGSANTLQFVFKMLSSSNAVVPANGMREVPAQLAERFEGELKLETPITGVTSNSVKTTTEPHNFDAVIVATAQDSAQKLCNLSPAQSSGWKSCTSIWFAADSAPTNDTYIHLGVETNVNNFAVMSNVSSHYAPDGKATMVATANGTEVTEEQLRADLATWFENQVDEWRTLEVQHIAKAQPQIQPGSNRQLAKKTSNGVILAGDYLADSSINGALESGIAAAALVN